MTIPLVVQHLAMSAVLVSGFVVNRLSLHRTARRLEAQEKMVANLVSAINELIIERNDDLVRENRALYAAASRAGIAVPGVLPPPPVPK